MASQLKQPKKENAKLVILDGQAELLASAKYALETAVVLAERQIFPGPALISEWKAIINTR